MNIVANSLGLGVCWSGFAAAGTELNPELKKKLGFADGAWRIITVLCVGHPKFKQKGMVKRHYRPVNWFRPGGDGPEVEVQDQEDDEQGQGQDDGERLLRADLVLVIAREDVAHARRQEWADCGASAGACAGAGAGA